MKLKILKKSAVEIVSDIGSKAFELQHYDDADIVEAVKVCRSVNPEMFAWLVNVLSSFRSQPDPPSGRVEGTSRSRQEREP